MEGGTSLFSPVDMTKVQMVKWFLALQIELFPTEPFVLVSLLAVGFCIHFSPFCTSSHLGSFNARTNRESYRNSETMDDMARRYMYTSSQQAASDEVAWGKIMLTLRPSMASFLLRFKNAGESPRSHDDI